MQQSSLSRFAPLVSALTLVAVTACAGISPSSNPALSRDSTGNSGPPPLLQSTWPVRTREHVDLWLHGYALVMEDTTLVPYFRRGYRDRLFALRRQRGVSTQLDANRAKLLAPLSLQPSLGTSGQFLPLYFSSWEQMRQAIDLFVRNGGNPRAASDQNVRMYFAILGSAFGTAADREWLRLFTESVDDENRRFYLDYWTTEVRVRGQLVSHVDSLWQRQWRPRLQRFLNNTQQQNGELYVSLPLGGEGRTIHYGKQENAVAVPLPDAMSESEIVLYVTAHEIAGAVASAAIDDNTTPADRRAGGASRYEQAAAVRAGALLLEKTVPLELNGYMRYYLQQAGRQAPTDPRSAFTAAFAVPDAVRDAIIKQLEAILGGI